MLDGFLIARALSDFLFGFGTFFAIINPYGLAFVFLDRTRSLSDAERGRIARLIAGYSLIVLAVSLLFGSAILGFFGVSLPALRIAGGLVVSVAGWSMLNAPEAEAEPLAIAAGGFDVVRRMAFFPLTIPLTTGPGTIAAAIALGATRNDPGGHPLPALVGSLLAAFAAALTVWHAYRRAGLMARLVGAEGTRVITRLSAFLLLCVGVEIILTGVADALRPLLQSR